MAFQTVYIPWIIGVQRTKAQRKVDFIAAHHCVVTGFAGKDAEKIYTCDNGMFLAHELEAKQ